MRIILKDGVDWESKYGFRKVGVSPCMGWKTNLVKDVGNFGLINILVFLKCEDGKTYQSDIENFTQSPKTKALLLDMILSGDVTLTD
jgi:hypothetical protein